jgi:hypothetical protein
LNPRGFRLRDRRSSEDAHSEDQREAPPDLSDHSDQPQLASDLAPDQPDDPVAELAPDLADREGPDQVLAADQPAEQPLGPGLQLLNRAGPLERPSGATPAWRPAWGPTSKLAGRISKEVLPAVVF